MKREADKQIIPEANLVSRGWCIALGYYQSEGYYTYQTKPPITPIQNVK